MDNSANTNKERRKGLLLSAAGLAEVYVWAWGWGAKCKVQCAMWC